MTTGPPMLVIYVWIRVAWAVRPMKWTKTAGAEAEVTVAVGQTEDRPRGYTLIYREWLPSSPWLAALPPRCSLPCVLLTGVS